MGMMETPASYYTNRHQCIFLYIHAPGIPIYPMVSNPKHALYIYNESMALVRYYPVRVLFGGRRGPYGFCIRGGSALKAIM